MSVWPSLGPEKPQNMLSEGWHSGHRRLMAAAMDATLVWVIFRVLVFFSSLSYPPGVLQILGFGLAYFIYSLLWMGFRGQTPGMKIFDLELYFLTPRGWQSGVKSKKDFVTWIRLFWRQAFLLAQLFLAGIWLLRLVRHCYPFWFEMVTGAAVFSKEGPCGQYSGNKWDFGFLIVLLGILTVQAWTVGALVVHGLPAAKRTFQASGNSDHLKWEDCIRENLTEILNAIFFEKDFQKVLQGSCWQNWLQARILSVDEKKDHLQADVLWLLAFEAYLASDQKLQQSWQALCRQQSQSSECQFMAWFEQGSKSQVWDPLPEDMEKQFVKQTHPLFQAWYYRQIRAYQPALQAVNQLLEFQDFEKIRWEVFVTLLQSAENQDVRLWHWFYKKGLLPQGALAWVLGSCENSLNERPSRWPARECLTDEVSP